MSNVATINSHGPRQSLTERLAGVDSDGDKQLKLSNTKKMCSEDMLC